MATATTQLQHSSIGSLEGIRRLPQVDQYLGIQYAKLANRFARGTLVEKYEGTLKATAVGPLPVANPQNCDNEHLLFQHALPHPEYAFSETECLTLNVSAPSQKAGAPLPVVVFIHGGGFATGSASWPQYDLAPLVQLSVANGSPIIAVGINYRLGPFGFLNSAAMRDAGFKPNNGLDDQKLALRWVQKHISGFNGDPTRVTAIGSSMGAVSGFFHLQSPEPLFSQFAALGGSPLIQPLPMPVAEIAFGIVTSVLGLDKFAPAEQVKALLQIPAEELSAKLEGVPVPLAALMDDDVVRSMATYKALTETEKLDSLFPGIKWCKTVLMGDCQFDGMIMGLTALSKRPDNLATSLRNSLSAVFGSDVSTPTAILKSYGIDEAKPDLTTILHFVNDVLFAAGTKATAVAWSAACGKTFLSHFNVPNPWDGPEKGQATHALDAALLLQNYNEFLGTGQRACAARMGRDMVEFVHGRQPFAPLTDGMSMVYYASSDGTVDESGTVPEADAVKTGRRSALVEIAAGDPEVLDKMLGAFGLLMQGGPK